MKPEQRTKYKHESLEGSLLTQLCKICGGKYAHCVRKIVLSIFSFSFNLFFFFYFFPLLDVLWILFVIDLGDSWIWLAFSFHENGMLSLNVLWLSSILESHIMTMWFYLMMSYKYLKLYSLLFAIFLYLFKFKWLSSNVLIISRAWSSLLLKSTNKFLFQIWYFSFKFLF